MGAADAGTKTGPTKVTPTKMTPMMAQYWRLKERHADAILMFRLGDFYEMFFDDAERAAAILDITLTARNKNDPTPIPLCGVPFHSVEPYIQKLLAAGLKVAICEQVEDPKGAKGLVDRDVVRVITPGTVLDEASLDPKTPSFLAVLAGDADGYALALAEVSTGELRIAEFPLAVVDGGAPRSWSAAPTDVLDAVAEEIARSGVKELVLSARLHDAHERIGARAPDVFRSLIPDAWYDAADAAAWLASIDDPPALGAAALGALGGLRAYLRETCRSTLHHLRTPEPYHPRDTLILDQTTRANLALLHGAPGERRGSLFAVLDRSATPMGGRTVRQWLIAPLTSPVAIGRRLDAVEILVEDPLLRESLRAALAGMGDVERLAGRVGARSASPRDLGRLAAALARVATLRERLETHAGKVGLLADVATALHPLPELQARIATLLVDDPPAALRGSALVRDGAHAEVDELRALARDGLGWVAALESRERKRTGIGSLKIRYNRIFGYAIEVTKPNLHLVPADYTRKQTLTGAERFVTEELKEHERKLLGAEERLRQLEAELFAELVAAVGEHQRELGDTARALGVLDALAALAAVAHERGYVRPQLDRGDAIVIRDGRHPIIEAALTREAFVPNDCTLDHDQQIVLITGPNMAGKSTYLRQVALIVVMAQMGSFVPAAEARIGIVDRVFTRVGASDNLAAGDSTFMVEMRETAHILRELTDRSLVVLDEIGRGTSTFDGIAIAWAVVEHLHEDARRPKTLFATHYYELTALARQATRLRNCSVAVREWKDEIIFLRRIVAGPASRSYGVEVARLAGLPASVVTRARGLLATFERGELAAEGRAPAAAGASAAAGQLGLFALQGAAVERRLRQLDVSRMTPIEALNELHALVEVVGGGKDDDPHDDS